MADMHKVGAKNKRSGNALENQTAKDFSAWYGDEFHRAPGSGSLHWHSVNVTADVLPPNDLEFPFIVECKSDKSSNWTIESLMDGIKHFPSWSAQAVREAQSEEDPKVPLLVFKRNRVKSYVSFPYTKKVAEQLTERNLSYAVSFVKFTGEVSGDEYLYHCVALPLWKVTEGFKPKDFEHCFTKSSLEKSLTLVSKKPVEEPAVNIEDIKL